MRYLRSVAIGFALALAVLGTLGPGPSAQPQDESATAMDARLAAATVARVGPSYMYPDPKVTPGMVNPDITQANIAQTICNPQWSTKTIRPPVSYTNTLKQKQLAQGKYKDKNPTHYNIDHLISLDLGGHPRDPRNLWPQAYEPRPGANEKDAVEIYLHRLVCSGELQLREAQRRIASDWYRVYLESKGQ